MRDKKKARPWPEKPGMNLPGEEASYILAYGSNLLMRRMAARCPDMRAVGTAWIPGHRMLFKQSRTGAYATIEQDANCRVPAAVYLVTLADEARLDRFEGCPKYYYKREFWLPVWDMDGARLPGDSLCLAYILHEDRALGRPSREYFRMVEQGYRDWGFDTAFLDRALADSIGNREAANWMKSYRKGEAV